MCWVAREGIADADMWLQYTVPWRHTWPMAATQVCPIVSKVFVKMGRIYLTIAILMMK